MPEIRDSYDSVAKEYASRIFNELDGKPLDRALLEEVVHRTEGLIYDMGCGPGHVAMFMSELGGNVVGIDLSPRMIAEARLHSPGLRFEIADILDLPLADASVGAAVAMYSLIHFDAVELDLAAKEIVRVLAPGGILLAAFHRGSQVSHVDDMWSTPVQLDYHFYEPDQMVEVLARSGLCLEKVVQREPYPDVEVQTNRFYIWAVKPA